MNGYLGWENLSAGKNCYDVYAANKTVNCLGGINVIPSNRRNILIVRHEDYVYHPKRILAQIFSFATRGVIDAEKDLDKFDLFGQENSIDQIKKLDVSCKMMFLLFEWCDVFKLSHLVFPCHHLDQDKKESGFYSTKDEDWDGAKELHAMCLRLGYSCNESPELFIDQS